MKSIISIILSFLVGATFLIVEFGIYISHSGTIRQPLIIGMLLTAVVTILTLIALYESVRHRNDKDPW